VSRRRDDASRGRPLERYDSVASAGWAETHQRTQAFHSGDHGAHADPAPSRPSPSISPAVSFLDFELALSKPDFRSTSRTGDLASSHNPSSRHRRLSLVIRSEIPNRSWMSALACYQQLRFSFRLARNPPVIRKFRLSNERMASTNSITRTSSPIRQAILLQEVVLSPRPGKEVISGRQQTGKRVIRRVEERQW
jgi:hypothetical protein